MFIVRYRDNKGKDRLVSIGKYSEGIREAYCKEKRAEFINLAKNGELPPRLKEKLKSSMLPLMMYFKSTKSLKLLRVKTSYAQNRSIRQEYKKYLVLWTYTTSPPIR